MSRFQYFIGKSIIIISSIVMGIPLGILAGIIYFFRVALAYPFNMYRIANKRWLEKIELKEQDDIWERHIRKMEEIKNVYKN